MDADDKWASDKLEKQIPLFEQQYIGVVYSRSSFIDSKGILLDSDLLGEYLQPRRGKVTDFLIFDNFVPFSSVIVKKECFELCGLFDASLTMGIDWDLWLRFSIEYQFDFVDEALLLYRVGHSGQMSRNLLERINCADKIITKFKATFPDVVSITKMKEVDYYTFCQRGYSLKSCGLRYPVMYYYKAISLFPFRKRAYIGFLKTLLRVISDKLIN